VFSPVIQERDAVPGAQELIVIAVVALLVFGPDRLPEVMRNAGRLLAKFREQSQASIDELKRAAELDDVNRELRGLTKEFRDTASGMGRELRDTGAAVSRQARDATGATGAPEASLEPPPMDPEAT
jgi:sec-independent protein translocase protein TatB